jgi:signal-transduction protein with cAMP-binding, CBS, and nucleotidyltransferase domain
MTAGELCSRSVVTAWPSENVRVAARRMSERDVGTLVVVDPGDCDRAIGVVTDRDITIRCVAANRDPDATLIAQVMSAPVQTVDEGASAEDALSKMARAGARRLVVSGDHALVGILSLDDMLDLLSVEAQSIGRLIEKQNPHTPL